MALTRTALYIIRSLVPYWEAPITDALFAPPTNNSTKQPSDKEEIEASQLGQNYFSPLVQKQFMEKTYLPPSAIQLFLGLCMKPLRLHDNLHLVFPDPSDILGTSQP